MLVEWRFKDCLDSVPRHSALVGLQSTSTQLQYDQSGNHGHNRLLHLRTRVKHLIIESKANSCVARMTIKFD